MQDPHRFVNDLDAEAHEKLIARLESRARDPIFSKLLDKYLNALDLKPATDVLEIGCGTGVVLRSLVRKFKITGKAYGIDQCASFIDAATDLIEVERLSDRATFQVGDVHNIEFTDEPLKVLSEISRVLKKGGVAGIFDGDYTSLTYGYPDHSFGRKMDAALASCTFNNPLIMRDLPRLFGDFGLEMIDAWGDAVVEIGKGSYFKTFADTYVPYVRDAQLFAPQAVDIWQDEQRKAMEDGEFFAACNYYSYIVRQVE